MDAEDVWTLALGLPQAEEAPHFHFTSFRVRGKIFATVPPERTHVHVFVDPARIDAAVAEDPAAVAELWWGKQRCGVRVDLAAARREHVEALLAEAWRRKAP
ncbi:MAG: MmcQ/YjbR family DNA-binding protein, partial [Myxococcota bacterium]